MYKELYNKLIKEIAEKPLGTFDNVLLDLSKYPVFKKLKTTLEGNTFDLRLPNDASEKDYKDYCELLCDFTNNDIEDFIDEETKIDDLRKNNGNKEKEDASKLFDVDLTEKESK